jgi:hypothetical protein
MRVQIFEGASSGEVSWSETLSVWGSVWMCHSVFTYTLLAHLVTDEGWDTVGEEVMMHEEFWCVQWGRCRSVRL